MFHRPWFARNLATAFFNFFAGFVGIVHFNRDMAVAVAQVVGRGVPVVGQFVQRKNG